MTTTFRHARVRAALVALLAFVSSGTAFAQVDPAAQAGAAWLATRVQADGALAGDATGIALPPQQEAETLQAIALVTGSAPAPLADRVAASTRDEAEFVAREALALVAANRDAGGAFARLRALQNADGGFAPQPGLQSSPYDTALALAALRHDPASPGNVPSRALAYLAARTPSAGFGAHFQSRVFVTAAAIVAADAWKQTYNVGAIVEPAKTWLLAQRQAGVFADTTDDAMALFALASVEADPAIIDPLVASLRAAQSAQGDWAQDNFITALATRALWRVTQQPPTPTTGAVAGRIVNAADGNPLDDATIQIVERPESTATSAGDGTFGIGALPPGTYTVRATRIGFAPAQVTVTVAAGGVVQLGDLAMQPAALTATLSGTVRNTSGTAIVDALVAVRTATATTSSTGAYTITGLDQGAATITITRSGYATVTANVTFVAGGNYVFSPTMVATNQTPPTTATLRGRLLDATTSAPLAGGTVTVGAASIASAADGRFTLANLPIGAFTATISATGYGTVTASGTLFGGVNDMGDARLTRVPTSSTLTGIVRDIDTAAPLAGVVVAVQSAGITSTTGADGRYTLANIANTAFQLLVTKDGYSDARYDVTLPQHGTHTLDLTIAPSSPDIGVTFREVRTSLPEFGPYDEFELEVEAQNTTAAGVDLVVDARIIDAQGNVAFELKANAMGLGQNPPNLPITIPGNAIVEIEMERILLRQPAGRYTVLARGYDMTGRVVVQGTTQFDVRAERQFGGAVTIDPPLAQAGTGQSVNLSASLTNTGNLEIPAGDYALTVTLDAQDTDSSQSQRTDIGTIFAGTPLQSPRGGASDADGNVYVANFAGKIVRIAPDDTATVVVTITGINLSDVARAPDGTLWASQYSGNRYFRISPEGVRTDFTTTLFSSITSLVLDASGDLYMTGTGNSPAGVEYRVVRRTAAGVESILWSNGLADPLGIALAPDGQLVISNQRDNTLVKMTTAGVVTPYLAGFNRPYGIVYGADGTLFVANSGDGTLTKIAPDGTRSTHATGLGDAGDLALAPTGDLFVTNRTDSTILRVTPAGVVELFSRSLANNPQKLVLEPDGSLVIGNDDGTLRRRGTDDTVTIIATGLSQPRGLLREDNGDYLIAAYGTSSLRRLSGGVLTNVATGLSGPFGVARGADGETWVTEANAQRIARFDAAGVALPKIETLVYTPQKLRRDSAGRLFIDNQGFVSVREGGVTRIHSRGTSYTDLVPDDAGGFTGVLSRDVWSVTAAGVATRLFTTTFTISGIAKLPGGDFLLVDGSNRKIHRLTTANVISEYAVFTSVPQEIVADSTGRAYVRTNDARISTIAPDGTVAPFATFTYLYAMSLSADERPVVISWQTGAPQYHAQVLDPATGVGTIIQNNIGNQDGLMLDGAVLTVADSAGYRLVDYTAGVVSGTVDGFITPRDIIWNGSAYAFVDQTYLYTVAPGGYPVRQGAFPVYYLAYRGSTLIGTGNGNLMRWNGTAGVQFNMIPSGNDLRGVAAMPDGSMYVAVGTDNRIAVVSPTDTLAAQLGGMVTPQGLAFNAAGDLFVGSANNSSIIRFDAGTRVPRFVARNVTNPRGLLFDTDGTLLVSRGSQLSRLDLATSVLTTVVSDSTSQVTGMAMVGTRLFLADSAGEQIRERVADRFDVVATGLAVTSGIRLDAAGRPVVTSRNNGTVARLVDGQMEVVASRLVNPNALLPRADGSLVVVGDSGMAYVIGADRAVEELRIAPLVGNQSLYGVARRGDRYLLFDQLSSTGTAYELRFSTATPPPPVGSVVHTATRSAVAFPVGEGHLDLDFGSWTPPYGGDFRAQVTRTDAVGTPTQFLHVGPYATGVLSTTTPVVAPGDVTVPLRLTLTGADFTSVSRVETAAFRKLVNISFPKGMTADRAGNVYFTDTTTLYRVATDGTTVPFVAGIVPQFGLAIDSQENLYLPVRNTTTSRYEVMRVRMDASTAIVADLGTTAVNGVATDSLDRVVIGRANALMRLDPATGIVTTIATNGLPSPLGVAVDGRDNIYVQNQNHVVTQILGDGRARVIFSRANGVDEPVFEGDGYPTITADCADNFYITAYTWSRVGQSGEEHILSQVVPRTGQVVGLIDTLRVNPSVGDIDYLAFDRFNNRILMWDHNTSAIYMVPVTCGAIGVEAHLKTRPGQTLSAFDLAPAATLELADGGREYVWSLRDVTAGGLAITFDTQLDDMALGEIRPAIASAHLAFQNTFAEGDITLPIRVPDVTAANRVAIEVATDAPEYLPETTVAITTTLANADPSPVAGELVVTIVDAQGAFVAEVLRAPVALAGNETQPFAATWPVGLRIAGGYRVDAVLANAERDLARGAAPFAVLADGADASATSRLQLDRSTYARNDRVRITSTAVSASNNTLQENLLLTVTTRDPGGTVIGSTPHFIDQLLPLATRTFESEQRLADALPGTYTVHLRLSDALDRTFDEHEATFVVESSGETGDGVTGTIAATPESADVGTPIAIAAVVRNEGNADVAALPVSVVVVDVARALEVWRHDQTIDIARDGEVAIAPTWATTAQAGGTYTAALVAHTARGDVTLASDDVQLVQVARDVAIAQAVVPPSRLLVLVSCKRRDATFMDGYEFGNDPLFAHGFEGDEVFCDPEARSGHLRALLRSMNIAADVTDDADTFAALRDGGDYPAYWISGWLLNLDETLRRHAREASYRGEGLLLDGDQAPRADLLDEATGMQWLATLSPAVRKVFIGDDAIYDEAIFSARGEMGHYLPQAATVHGTLGTTDGPPALARATHGRGTTATFTFDLVDALMSDGAPAPIIDVLQRTLDAMATTPRETWHAHDLVPIRTTLTNNEAATLSLVVALTAPAGVAFESHDPPAATSASDAIEWRLDLAPGATVRLDANVRIGEDGGAKPIATRIAIAGEGGAIAETTLPLAVRDRFAQGEAALAAIRALAPVDAGGITARDAAVAATLRGLRALDQDDFDVAETALLDAADALITLQRAGVAGAGDARVDVAELLRITAHLRSRAVNG